MLHAGAVSSVPVWVMRMKRARTGCSRTIDVLPGVPLPVATGRPHAWPSSETWTS